MILASAPRWCTHPLFRQRDGFHGRPFGQVVTGMDDYRLAGLQAQIEVIHLELSFLQ